ncbi:MAG: flagellin [Polyangiales bacterium]
MAISILTNQSSLSSQKNLQKTTQALSANFSKLSSGQRINSAADDAAGLAISEKMKTQMRSMSQAERNANDGISLLQTAEGALNENAGVLTRMRELAMQSANGTLGTTERDKIQTEFTQLRTEIGRIADATEFNGQKLLKAGGSTISFQVGIKNDSATDRIDATMVDGSIAGYGIGSASVATAGDAQAALDVLDTALEKTSKGRADLGSVQNRLQVTVSNLQTANTNLAAANSRIRDVDVAEESAAMTKNNVLSQAGIAVLSQANQLPSMALSLLRG